MKDLTYNKLAFLDVISVRQLTHMRTCAHIHTQLVSSQKNYTYLKVIWEGDFGIPILLELI